MRFFVENEEI